MAVLVATPSKAKPKKIIDYITNKEKTDETLVSGHNCTPESALEEFNATKEMYNKKDGIQYHHYKHSFKPGEVTPEKAHELGKELAEKIGGGKYECLIATHVDKEHIHNHIVVNSVSFDDGKKFHSSKADLKHLKEFTNKQAEREGLSKMDFDKSAERISTGELRLRLKGVESWKEDLRKVIKHSRARTSNLKEMKEYLRYNFNVGMKIQNKNVKYLHPEKERFIGGKKLGDEYNREGIEKYFESKLQDKALFEENKRLDNLSLEEEKRLQEVIQADTKRLDELSEYEREQTRKYEEKSREERQIKEEARKLAEKVYQDIMAQEALKALDEYIRQEAKRLEELKNQKDEAQDKDAKPIERSLNTVKIDDSTKEKWWKEYQIPREYMEHLMKTETDPVRFNQKLMYASDLLIEWRKRDMEREAAIQDRLEGKQTGERVIADNRDQEDSIKNRLDRIKNEQIEREVERRGKDNGVIGYDSREGRTGENSTERANQSADKGVPGERTITGTKEIERSKQEGIRELTLEGELGRIDTVLRDIEERAGRNVARDKSNDDRSPSEGKQSERQQQNIEPDDRTKGRSFDR